MRQNGFLIFGFIAYLFLSAASLAIGEGKFSPGSPLFGNLLCLGGPCTFLLWGIGALPWFLAGSVLFWGSLVVARRLSDQSAIWISCACLTWIGASILSFALSA